MNGLTKFFGHLKVVTLHRHRVISNGLHMGIFWHCLRHDLTKFGPTEFWNSVKYFAGDHSPVYEERLSNEYFSKICQHHTRRNKHHYEYWTDFFCGRVLAKRMPYVYATEYVCDILAASKTYHPDSFKGTVALEYFQRHSKRYFIHPATVRYVEECLKRYSEDGFKRLKKKETKALYEELAKQYPDTVLFTNMPCEMELPPLKGEQPTSLERNTMDF